MADNERALPVFLTAAEVADMLRMSERTLETWRTDKKGPKYMRLGHGGRAKVIYNLEDVKAWLKTQEKG